MAIAVTTTFHGVDSRLNQVPDDDGSTTPLVVPSIAGPQAQSVGDSGRVVAPDPQRGGGAHQRTRQPAYVGQQLWLIQSPCLVPRDRGSPRRLRYRSPKPMPTRAPYLVDQPTTSNSSEVPSMAGISATSPTTNHLSASPGLLGGLHANISRSRSLLRRFDDCSWGTSGAPGTSS